MNKSITATFIMVIALGLGGCSKASSDKNLSRQAAAPTYAGCLQAAVSGNTYLSAGNIRSLCAEAAQVVDAQYEFKNGKMVPSNDFTRCYDKEKKKLKQLKVPEATRLAKLSCKYPDVK